MPEEESQQITSQQIASQQITGMLSEWRDGNEEAGRQIIAAVYRELKASGGGVSPPRVELGDAAAYRAGE